MTVSIAGVNVGIGIDLESFFKGISDAEKELREFSVRMSKIRLRGLITDDTEKATKNYLQESKNAINSVFSEWSKNILYVRENLNKFAIEARQNAANLMQEFRKIDTARVQWLGYSKEGVKKEVAGIIKGVREALNISAKQGVSVADVVGATRNSMFGDVQKILPTLQGISEAADKEIDKLRKYLSDNLDWQEKDVLKSLEKIKTHVEQRGPRIAEAYEKLGLRIRTALSQQEELTYKSNLAEAGDPTNALRRQITAARELEIQMAKARTEIGLGINIDKNRQTLLQAIEQQQALGIPLEKERISLYRQEYEQKIRLQKIDELQRARWDAEIKVAKDITQISIRRRIEEQELRRAIQQSRTEIAAKYHVDENYLAIMKNLQQLQRAGIHLTDQETTELNKLNKQRRELEKSAGTTKNDSFFSKEWFMNRARWFMQLRGFWEIYRQLTTALTGGLEFEQQMSEVRAVTQATGKDFEDLKQKALDVGNTTIFSATEAAKGMVTLGQAGLNTKEILTSIADIAVLASATMFDLGRTSELVVSVMRAWGYEANNTKYIVDVLATSINKTRLTMEGLSVGMSYMAGIAPQLNITLEESVALFGALTNRGVSFSIAATSIRAMLDELLHPTQRFVKELAYLGIRLDEIDPKTNNIIDILNTLQKAGWGVENSFAAFERRAATGIAVLVDSASSLKNLANNMYEQNRASMMSIEQLDNLNAQWKQFQDINIQTADTIFTSVRPALIGLIDLFKTLSSVLGTVIKPIASIIGTIGKGLRDVGNIILGKFGNIETAKSMKKVADEIQNLQTKIDDIVSAYLRLRTAYEKFEQTFRKGEAARSTKEATKNFSDAIDIAHRAGLITREQVPLYKSLIESADGRVKIEQEVLKNFQLQSGEMDKQVTSYKSFIEYRSKFLASIAKEKINTLLNQLDKDVEEYKKGVQRYSEVKYKGMLKDMQFPNPMEPKAVEKTAEAIQMVLQEALKDANVGDLLTKDPRVRKFMDSLQMTGKGKMKEFIDQYTRLQSDYGQIWGTDNIDALAGTGKPKEKRSRWLTTEEQRRIWQDQMRMLKSEDAIIDRKIQGIKLDEITIDEYEKILELNKKREQNEKELANLQTQIEKSHLENEKEKTDIELAAIDNERRVAIEKARENRDLADKRALETYYKQVIESYQLQRDSIQNEIDTLSKEAQQLYVGGLTGEKEKKVLETYSKINELANQRAKIEFLIADLQDKNLKEARAELDMAIEKNDEVAKANALKALQAAINNKLKRIEHEAAQKLYDIEEKRIELSEQVKLTQEKTLELNKQELEVELAKLDAQLNVTMLLKDSEKELQIRQQILQTQLKLKQVTYDLARAQNPLLDAVHKFRTEYSDLNKDLSNIIYGGFQSLGSGLTDFAYKVSGGFQDRQQEVANLKGELTELNGELSETQIGISQAITDKDEEQFYKLSEQAEQIKERMRLLNQEISKLESPLEGAKDAFKDFFKTFVEELRKAIIQMMVFRLIAATIGLIFGKGTTVGEQAAMQANAFGGLSAAHGGILPNILSFRKFSNGGITGSPTIAMLGDNKTHRELIIPEENIKSDNVSGYIRNKQEDTINIFNILTKEDIANAMAGTEGERVIINTIGKDLVRNGPLYRQMKR